ncbi:MAG: DUF362 domain-containing protein [Thermoplasmata archaeon]|nr:DUF362 domain-containing protein [Thermoplasmata archaeon]
MTFQSIDDLEIIREAHARDERFIIVFSVEDSSKIERLGEFVDKLDLFAPLAGRSCFLKPNMVSSEVYPTTTDAEVLGFVLERLKGACSKVAVGDSPAQGKMDTYEHPVAKVCKDLGVEFLDLRGTKTRLMGKNPIHDYPLEFDSIISLPVLKEHFVCGMTFALKNNFGLTRRSIRMGLHMRPRRLDKVIAQLHGEYPVNLVIGDACRTMRKAQEKRWGGVEDDIGLFFLSNAPLELDLLAWKLYPGKKVRHLDFAREMYGEKDVLIWVEEGIKREFS